MSLGSSGTFRCSQLADGDGHVVDSSLPLLVQPLPRCSGARSRLAACLARETEIRGVISHQKMTTSWQYEELSYSLSPYGDDAYGRRRFDSVDVGPAAPGK
ncbi:unnamed protein product [Heligmosomoides polygyrus]|uniref:Uncharacterized protein n=1 Tax=Heligmosomoides polygyrus TaxID=6339 RepID=A0A183FQR0_HELPZ|nr:unnamed protein product [Heligmosomoides polygyrus]